MSDEEKGARSKDRSLRMKQPVDYKRLHEGTGHVDPTPERIMRSGSQTVLGSPGGSLEEDVMGVGAVSAAGSDLGHESAKKVLHDLDREIEELEVSIREVNSQLKEASLKKQQKERTDKLARLR